MKTIKVKLTLLEDMLGTASSSPDLYAEYIASKNEKGIADDELEAVENAESLLAEDKPQTVFPRDNEGNPILWDYQIKGFFKDACGVLRKIKGSESSKIKAYKKEIDGLIFPQPRQIKINTSGEINFCSRPLRAQTPQGERISITKSEQIPAGSTIEFEILLLNDSHESVIKEWLEYGKLRGLGQWRNSGKGRFIVEYID